jgi:hypothetical protein
MVCPMIRSSLSLCTFVAVVFCWIGSGQAVVINVQEGLSGYVGTQDTHIRGGTGLTGTANGAAAAVVADGDDTGGPTHALIRFDNLFGLGPNQIPVGATIVSAELRLNTDNVSPDAMRLHQMLQTWTEAATFAGDFGGNGVQANNIEAGSTIIDTINPTAAVGSTEVFDVTTTLQAWVTNPASNFGWAILPTGTDGYQFKSSEHGTQSQRPLLFVDFFVAVPEPSSIALFSILGVVGVAAAGWCGRRRYSSR